MASCFPEAVRAGASGNPLYFVLGGIFGLLADTMDFKFSRFFYRHHKSVTPDPNKPDPQEIADVVAEAVNQAHETGEAFRVRLNSIRLGSDLWQQYEVKFDIPAGKVVVNYGPVVNTGQTPVPGSKPPGKEGRAEAALFCGIKLEYHAATTIDIFDGPIYEMMPTDDGRVMPKFIPWHRKWSHSVVTGLGLGLVGAVTLGPLAGLIVFGAFGAHILLDQLGYMGSSLLFPLSSRRIEGLKIMHSGQALPNFAAVWLSCLVIFWNLYCSMSWRIPNFTAVSLLFYGVAIPTGLLWAFRRLSRGKRQA